MFDADRLARSRAYVEANATPRQSLAVACGLDERTLSAAEAAGVLPAPTYVISERGIASPIRSLGEPAEHGCAFYGPSVLGWVRRAALYQPSEAGLLDRMQGWFAQTFAEALMAQAEDARVHAWEHLFTTAGTLDAAALCTELERLNGEWLQGGWAVCLRQWNGHHVVTKDLERARIGAMTEGRDTLAREERIMLFNAIERLDAVMMPFAPYERPHGTPGLFIDAMRERYRL